MRCDAAGRGREGKAQSRLEKQSTDEQQEASKGSARAVADRRPKARLRAVTPVDTRARYGDWREVKRLKESRERSTLARGKLRLSRRPHLRSAAGSELELAF
eukprot:15481478-Alexandrium_andersonii.AAC.1